MRNILVIILSIATLTAVANGQFPGPDFPQPDFPAPDFPEPDFPEPDFPEPDFPEPDFPEPDFPEPDFQIPDPLCPWWDPFCTGCPSWDPNCHQIVLQPDLKVVSIASGGCSGGDPLIEVTVRNVGAAFASAYVDVFVGRSSPPPIGTFSSYYAYTTLAPQQSRTLYIKVGSQHEGLNRWVDVLIDTDQRVAESDETNNHMEKRLTVPNCP